MARGSDSLPHFRHATKRNKRTGPLPYSFRTCRLILASPNSNARQTHLTYRFLTLIVGESSDVQDAQHHIIAGSSTSGIHYLRLEVQKMLGPADGWRCRECWAGRWLEAQKGLGWQMNHPLFLRPGKACRSAYGFGALNCAGAPNPYALLQAPRYVQFKPNS